GGPDAVGTHAADSCLCRMRELLPAVKLIGRPVLVLDHDALGSRCGATQCSLPALFPAPLPTAHTLGPDPYAARGFSLAAIALPRASAALPTPAVGPTVT